MDTEPSDTYGESSSRISLTPTRRFDVIHIDYGANVSRSTNGNNSYLVAIDVYTKNTIVYPVRESSTDSMIGFLEEIFVMYGIPRIIISDNNIRFSAQAYVELVQRHNIIAIRTNTNFNIGNLAERTIRQIRHMITALSRNNLSWDENLQNLVNRALR